MPRTKEQNRKILDQRKKDIIKCAINVFSVKDYKSATIDDITKSLKISHGLFYHYFKNKTDLIKGIVEYADGAVMSKFKEIANNYTEEEFFYNYFSLFISLLKDQETALMINFLSHVMSEEVLKNPASQQTILDKFYSSFVYKNVKLMSEKGKLIQSVGSTFKLMIVITRGLISLALDNKLDKGIISPKNILKSVFIIEGEEE